MSDRPEKPLAEKPLAEKPLAEKSLAEMAADERKAAVAHARTVIQSDYTAYADQYMAWRLRNKSATARCEP